jgi:flagellar L-ring protein FlgH
MNTITRWNLPGLLASLLLTACAGAPPLPEPQPRDYREYEELVRPTSGAIYDLYSGVAYLEDQRARRVGDILIVRLSERTDAKKASDTNVTKNNTTTITNPVLAGRTRTLGDGPSTLGFDLDSDHSFAGQSDSSQSNQLNGTIAVRVINVLPDGNLVIEGEKWLTINRGKEFIRVRGLVRPVDIGDDNTIASSIIANAEIAYSGTGEGADSNRMGWLSRFFIGPAWPF